MHSRFIYLAAGILAGASCAVSCVEINEELGKEYIPTRHQYDVYTDTIYLHNIRLEQTDKLSGYSSARITVGAVMDNVFGLTSRSCAFPLIPVDPDMDFGENTQCTQFHFTAVRDTVSYPDKSQEHIIQNIRVYSLDEEIGEDASYINEKNADGTPKLKYSEQVASCTYFGGDSLSFDLKTSFGQKYIDEIKNMQKDPDKKGLDSVVNFVNKLPGIFIKADAPISAGGRINMFDLKMEISESYYVSGNYAELKFRADYGDRKGVDSSFLFFFGAQAMQVYEDAESEYVTPARTAQYALNLTDTRYSGEVLPSEGGCSVTDKIYVEGGGGLKPVISSQEIKESLGELFANEGIDPADVIIHKASIVLPYDFQSENYDQMYLYPYRLSPTCRITLEDDETGEEQVTYAGLTDASVETENQGDINRSLNCYAPDISHHVQEILRRADDTNYSDYDIWMLTMAEETIETENSGNSAMSDYYRNLAYYDYYNSMYNPYGYGGYYGGYYGYGYNSYYGMSNYYNYMLAAQYASQSSTTTSVSVQLDKDRYYRGILRGPGADGGYSETNKNLPRMTVTYSVSKTSGK